MRPSIEAKVDELIRDMMKQGAPVDLQEHFSLPIAFKVIYEILGIPFEVRGKPSTYVIFEKVMGCWLPLLSRLGLPCIGFIKVHLGVL